MFAVFLSAVRYCIIVDNAYWIHQRQNCTVIVTNVKYWQKRYNVPTVANGRAVCLRLALRRLLT